MKPAALITTFDDPDTVTEVYLDPPPADGDGEFDDRPEIDLIAEALCPSGTGLCAFLFNTCVYCGEPAPWVHRPSEHVS